MTQSSSTPAAAPPPPDRRIWVDGALVPWQSATVHVLSHSFARGSMVFDYLSVHATPRGAAIFRLGEHVERFQRSVSIVGLPIEQDHQALFDAALAVVRANPGCTALKMMAFLPSEEVGVVPMDERVSVAMAAYDPLRDVILKKPVPRRMPAQLSVKLERSRRRIGSHLPVHAKAAANYLGAAMAAWAARKEGYDEIVMLDEAGHLAEAPTSNVFVVDTAGTLRTPSLDGVLPGITRQSLLEIAKHEGIATHDGVVEADELIRAREAFLSSTSIGVWPIASVDGNALPAPVPGPVSARLKARFDAITAGEDAAFAHWLTLVAQSPSGRS